MKTLETHWTKVNRVVVLILSLSVLFFIACQDDDDEESCMCTLKACRDGVSVIVKNENGEPFSEGVYTLRWETGSMSGEVEIDDRWSHNEDPATQIFYIYRYSDSGKEILTQDAETIILELYSDGTSVSEPENFDLNWETTVCNYCSGPCDDQMVTNAEIQMAVTVP